jgi:psp operon transcriptional activator
MKRQAPTIIGSSPRLAAALDHISRLASIDRPALIIGERGTGKELAAERLHFLSPRWDQTFTKINCSAISDTLLESELFGHEAGAFTGATKQHLGRFELTDGGTLFLDELATMSLRLQEKLLRVIEYGEFERVGGQKTLQVDVRIVAATNADLPALANQHQFRWDLLDRLSFDVVKLPPLRERGDDVMELAQHFAVRMCAELGWTLFSGFAAKAERQLREHAWPGNVRELKNVVERSLFRSAQPDRALAHVVVDPFGTLDDVAEPTKLDSLGSLSGAESTVQWPVALKALLETEEKTWVERALEQAGQRQKEAATLLGITYHQMRALVRKHHLATRPSRQRSGPAQTTNPD